MITEGTFIVGIVGGVHSVVNTSLRVGRIVGSKNVRVIELCVLPNSGLRAIVERNVSQVWSGVIIG